MVDTISMQIHLNSHGDLMLKHNIEHQIVPLKHQPFLRGNIQYGIFTGKIKHFGIWFNSIKGYVLIHFNPSNLLNKKPQEKDVNAIEQIILSFVKQELKIAPKDMLQFNLNRIDYKIDFRVNSNEEKSIIYDLMNIATNRFNNIVKIPTKTSIRYNPKNGYIEFITYDKEQEVIDKGYFKGTELEFFKKYQNVIRTEIRIKNRKLNYNRRKFGLAKDLSNYLKEDMAEYYFNTYAEKIWYSEDFYRIDIALKIINNAKNLSKNMKKKLCNLLKTIHFFGFSSSQQLYDKKYSRVTFRDHIKRIRALGINPLTFKSTYSIKKMKNFSLRKGDIS